MWQMTVGGGLSAGAPSYHAVAEREWLSKKGLSPKKRLEKTLRRFFW